MGKDLKGKELGVGISQQSDGLYVARCTDINGRRRAKRFHKLQECRSWLAAENQNKAEKKATNDMIVDEWFTCWIKIKEQTTRVSTYESYRHRYQVDIYPVIGKMLLTEVKPIHCQKVFTNMAQIGRSNGTMELTRVVLYGLLSSAAENDLIDKNPCLRSIKSNIGKPKAERTALTKAEQEKFVKLIQGCLYENQFRLILQTGLRIGEVAGLQWGDIDFKKKTLAVNRTAYLSSIYREWMVGLPKSSSGKRLVPLTEEAVRILKKQKQEDKTLKVIQKDFCNYVFLSTEGGPIPDSKYCYFLRRLCRESGLRSVTPHVLRHTFATRCIEAGMKPKTLQKILGHANIGITMNVYVHISEEEKMDEINKISYALNF